MAAVGPIEQVEVDFDDPATCPPAGCVDPVMWGIAGKLFSNHTLGHRGACDRCGGCYPCLGRMLAETGLRTAMGEDNRDSDYWRGYARIHEPVS